MTRRRRNIDDDNDNDNVDVDDAVDDDDDNRCAGWPRGLCPRQMLLDDDDGLFGSSVLPAAVVSVSIGMSAEAVSSGAVDTAMIVSSAEGGGAPVISNPDGA